MKLQPTPTSLALAATLALAVSGCGAEEGSARDVAITFRAVVGAQPFSCGSTYPGVGTAADPANRVLTPKDARFYVHDVRLVRADGAEVPVTLAETAPWQSGGVALLDFEDGTGSCAGNGNALLNAVVRGTVPTGDYRGLAFKVGVPAPLNHLRADGQPAPLNLSAMFWSWTSGYRFLRVEGTLPGAIVHVGSTGCTLNDPADPAKGAACVNENVTEVGFAAFDADANRVVFDVGELFSGTDLSVTNAPSGGCMSAPTDPDCPPVFERLGLPFGGSAGGAQSVFSVE